MWIFNNFFYKVIALLIAVVLWSTAQGFRSVEQGLDLPIAIENVPPDLVVISRSVDEINVRIKGSLAAVRSAKKQLVHYPISLQGAKPGQRTYPVTDDRLSLPRGARILARSPSTVVLEIESVTTKRVPVRVDVVGEPPEGYRIASVSVEPAKVRLEGARKIVRQLREVVTDRVDVSRLRETTVQEVPLLLGVPYVWRAGEERGKPVRVEVHVERLPGTGGES